MAQLTISQVAKEVGLRPSAVRYYEQQKILPAAPRISGQRRYDTATVNRLAVIRCAHEAGFSLEEIRRLFSGFDSSTPIAARWKKLAAAKVTELNERIERIQSMKDLLERLQTRCACDTIEQCGAGILRAGLRNASKAQAGGLR